MRKVSPKNVAKQHLRSPKPIHPFPARMASELALRHLQSRRKLTVLDPMVGSGTVVRIAQAMGHLALGFDTDPLALMIAETWCRSVEPSKLENAAARVAKRAANWKQIPAKRAYPKNASIETQKFIRFWFDLRARRQLTALMREVNKVLDRTQRLYLLTAISRTIIVKDKGVSRARDVSHSRPHRSYKKGPSEPLDAFKRSTSLLTSLVKDEPSARGTIKIRRGDARNLPLKDETVDLVITSPPYLNAIDYLRGHKLSLVWFGHQVEDLRDLRASNIGAESGKEMDTQSNEIFAQVVSRQNALPDRQKRMLCRYIADIRLFMGEVFRVLRPKGQCVVIVGDSNLGGTFIRNSRAIQEVAASTGFILKHEYRRKIPNVRRYLPPPSAQESGEALRRRMRTEVVIVLTKN